MEGKPEERNEEKVEQPSPPEEEKAEEKKEEVVEEKKEEAAEEKKEEAVEEKKSEEKVVEEKLVEEKKEEAVEEKAAEEKAEDRKWYVIQTLTGYEDRVKTNVERSVENLGLQNKIFKVLIPEEETVEIRGNKRIEKVKRMYPGYVFVEMILDDETWYAVRQTPGVARFIGGKTRPTPVTDREMTRVLKQLGVKEERIEIRFEKGEAIRIISGPFRGYTGSVDEVNAEKGKVKALINIFGRDTPVEINFDQAEKIV